MNHKLLQELSPLNPTKLNEVFNQYGVRLGAVYQIKDSDLVQLVIPEGDQNIWPVSTPFTTNYTPNYSSRLPVGWVKLQKKFKAQKIWPKGVHFYYPFQNDYNEKILFIVKPVNPRVKEGALFAPLEIIGARILKAISQQSLTTFVNESIYEKSVHDLTQRIEKSFSGYFEKHLKSLSSIASNVKEHLASSFLPRQDLNVLSGASKNLSELAEELEVGYEEFKVKYGLTRNLELEPLDLRPFLMEIVESSKASCANDVKIRVIIDHEKTIDILGPKHELQDSISQVVNYCAEHSARNEVTMSVFISNRSVVLDILDDGPGVEKGMENLIFLKYYRQRTIRGLKNLDLGLGLNFSRSIVREIGGDLLHVRSSSGGSVFRFILPIATESALARAS